MTSAIPTLPWRCQIALPPCTVNQARLPVTMHRKDGRVYNRLIKAPELGAWEAEQSARLKEQRPPALPKGTPVVICLRISVSNAAMDCDNAIKQAIDLLTKVLGRPSADAKPRVIRRKDGTTTIAPPLGWDDRSVMLIVASKVIDRQNPGIDCLVDWADEALMDEVTALIVDRPRNAWGVPLERPGQRGRRNLAIVRHALAGPAGVGPGRGRPWPDAS
jgi:hypothetical protein